MSDRNTYRISLQSVLLMLCGCACLIGLSRSWMLTDHYRAELDRLRKTTQERDTRSHPKAQLQIIRNGETMSGPGFLTADNQWFGGNLQVKTSAGATAKLSYKGRYLYSANQEDVYLMMWSTESQLPPMPSLNDQQGHFVLVSVTEGVNKVIEDDFWEMQIVAPTK